MLACTNLWAKSLFLLLYLSMFLHVVPESGVKRDEHHTYLNGRQQLFYLMSYKTMGPHEFEPYIYTRAHMNMCVCVCLIHWYIHTSQAFMMI
jgi:hypothetical protein